MGTIVFYQIPQALFLTLPVTGASLMNYPVNRTDFKLFKNVTNEVTVFLKDQDRRALNLIGKTVYMYIVDDRQSRLVLVKELKVVDEYRGMCELRTTPTETTNLLTGYYRFSVMVEREDGTQKLVYTDQDYGPHSYCEVVEGPVPPPVVSTDIPGASFLIASQGTPPLDYAVSSPYPGAAAVGHSAAIHGAAIYTTGWNGQLWIEASLENAVPSFDTDWFTVSGPTQFANVSGITYVTFDGNFMWVRFKLLADNTFLPNGSLDRILYRN